MLHIVKKRNYFPGISQFWANDYKVFDQIYGRTSDKDLYGATLPPPIRFDAPKTIQIGASNKNERYVTYEKNILDPELPYDFSDRYAKLFSKSLHTGKSKPSSALQFISFSDFKPISKSTDPETYNYLKNLEKKTKQKETKNKAISSDFEEDEAYKSIQDILDAHEANKADSTEEPRTKRPKESVRNRNRSKVRFINNNSIKSSNRCVSGRCRAPVRTRPYLKIKRYRYSKR